MIEGQALLSAATPDYVGTSFVEIWPYEANVKHPAAAEVAAAAR